MNASAFNGDFFFFYVGDMIAFFEIACGHVQIQVISYPSFHGSGIVYAGCFCKIICLWQGRLLQWGGCIDDTCYIGDCGIYRHITAVGFSTGGGGGYFRDALCNPCHLSIVYSIHYYRAYGHDGGVLAGEDNCFVSYGVGGYDGVTAGICFVQLDADVLPISFLGIPDNYLFVFCCHCHYLCHIKYTGYLQCCCDCQDKNTNNPYFFPIVIIHGVLLVVTFIGDCNTDLSKKAAVITSFPAYENTPYCLMPLPYRTAHR